MTTTVPPREVAALQRALPGTDLRTDPATVAALGADDAEWAEVGTALAVVRARDAEEVARGVRASGQLRVPVVPRGAGTGLSGGANAVDGGIVLDLFRMDRVLEIDADDLRWSASRDPRRGGARAGGHLAVQVHDGDTAPVLALHGVSSNARLWNWLRAAAPLRRHADDLVAVLDELGLDRVTVCGMSMGGSVAVVLATAHPDRLRDLVLVDGGLPRQTPEGLTPAGARTAVAAQAGRAAQTLPDLGAYADLFLAGTPLLDRDDPLLRDHLAHDLCDGRVRLDPEVVVADAVDTLLGASPWRELHHPTRRLFAEWAPARARRLPIRPTASPPPPRSCPRCARSSSCPASTTRQAP